jgi:5-methylcytosine-specific restriction endonuclease McrA
MPFKAPRICGCGRKVPWSEQCECQRRRIQEAKRRHDATRPSARERGYDSKWETERKAFLICNPVCRRCGAPATIVHHIVPHRGDRRLFWSRSNWMPSCQPCHDGPLQAAERRAREVLP